MKKEKTTPAVKVSAYSSLAVSMIAFAGSADGQVIYTDIVDYTGSLNGDIYKLDLDNSGSTDFDIFRKGTFPNDSYEGVFCDAPGSNGVVGAGGSASALAINTVVSSSNNFLTGSGDRLMASNSSSSGKSGPWVAQTDHYLGLMIMISGSPHYGWARLDVNKPCDVFVIKDYAYEKTAKKKILAGDMGSTTKVSELAVNEALVYVSGKTIKVDGGTCANAMVSVKSILGQEVKSFTAAGVHSEIDMAGQPSGVYFVTVSVNGIPATTKVFVGQ